MAKIYRVLITEVDVDTGEEVEQINDEYTGLTMLGTQEEHIFNEVVLHDNILRLATKMAAGSVTKKAVRMANAMLQIHDENISDIEGLLTDAIGGLQ